MIASSEVRWRCFLDSNSKEEFDLEGFKQARTVQVLHARDLLFLPSPQYLLCFPEHEQLFGGALVSTEDMVVLSKGVEIVAPDPDRKSYFWI